MPIGELVGEVFLRVILEIIFYPIFYYSGAIVLGSLTLGRLKMAPLSATETINKGKTRWNDWSIWLRRSPKHRVLKAECVMLAGIVSWIAVGIGAYYLMK